MISIGVRNLAFRVLFGQEKEQYESTSEAFEMISLKIYKNGKFYARVYDMGCQTEHIGTYKLSKEMLDLKFKNQKPEYLGTEYLIENEMLLCLNCENEQKLEYQKTN